MSNRLVRVAFPLIALVAMQGSAAAAPNLRSVENFGRGVTEFLINNIGPLAFGIALCIAAFCYFFAAENGGRYAKNALIGGVLLFAAPSIVEWVRDLVR